MCFVLFRIGIRRIVRLYTPQTLFVSFLFVYTSFPVQVRVLVITGDGQDQSTLFAASQQTNVRCAETTSGENKQGCVAATAIVGWIV